MAKGGKPRTVDIARELCLPVLEELGLELWDLRFEKEGSDWYLRYFIDKEGGVNIQDCEAFSRGIDRLLDEADPIDRSYILEVSSPGIERKLIRDEHFARYLGHRIRMRLIRPRPPENIRELVGELAGKDGQGVQLRLDSGEEIVVPNEDIAYVRLEADI